MNSARLRGGVLCWLLGVTVLLSACAVQDARTSAPFQADTRAHLHTTMDDAEAAKNALKNSAESLPVDRRGGKIPPPVKHTRRLPVAQPPATYSVTVHDAPLREVLLALAKQAQVNMDIHNDIGGRVTVNALKQTLPELLNRLCEQAGARWEHRGGHVVVMEDRPFLRHYAVDYLNMARQTDGQVSANMQIATQTQVGGGLGGASALNNVAGNLSSTAIDNSSRNDFWRSLVDNVRDILQGSQPSPLAVVAPPAVASSPGSPNHSKALANNALKPLPSAVEKQTPPTPLPVVRDKGATVMVHPESGTVTVRATAAQHRRVAEFLRRVSEAAQRQVLIEATIIEVLLNNRYEQGIDWSQLAGAGTVAYLGNKLKNTVNFSYQKTDDTNALISLLETFGSTRVLSSPRVAVLNNQTALLKVVENYVYFNVKADTTNTANVGSSTVYTTTPQTVSVGLVMGVTPQVSSKNVVILNVRPTITQVGREVADPNPDLHKSNIQNLVPVIRTREIESVLRIPSGQIAILGGLMEDRVDNQRQAVPLLGQIPLLGEIFTNRNELKQKSELVVLLRPLVVNHAKAPATMQVDEHFFDSAHSFSAAANAANAVNTGALR